MKWLAVDERKRVLVLLSDMTAFADALKEVSIAMDQVPANRGYPGREDHNQIMNTMIRFYSQAKDAQQKQAMAFELSAFDQKLLKFGKLFRDRFMDINVSLPLEEALDLSWQTLGECFEPQELLMKQALVDKYYPRSKPTSNPTPANGQAIP